MNVGLSNLATLARHLLPETWDAQTDASENLQQVLADLGLGMASQMEEFCARKFSREVGATLELPADCRMIQLPRFPIEGTPVISARYAGSAVWEVQSDAIDQVAMQAGIVYLIAPIGTRRDRVKVTWTGGYWFNTADEPDEDETLPAGATALPEGLKLNWLLQCQHILAGRELLAIKTLPSGKAALAVSAEAQIQLLQTVKDALSPYRILAA